MRPGHLLSNDSPSVADAQYNHHAGAAGRRTGQKAASVPQCCLSDAAGLQFQSAASLQQNYIVSCRASQRWLHWASWRYF